MNLCEIIKSRRTIRRFKNEPISRETLIELLEAARNAPSAANRQPLEYIIIDEPGMAENIFEQLAWAGYVRPKRNPPDGGKPAAYIVVLRNTVISPQDWSIPDAAAAIENIMLAAWCEGIGSCWIGSVQRDKVRDILNIPRILEIDSVLALGVPDEKPVMEDIKGDSIEYYLDEQDRLHVPKRTLETIVHVNRFGKRLK